LERISISSNAFEHEATIPARHTCDSENLSPQLRWKRVPEKTKSLALIMDDPDAPGRTFVHWVIFNMPKDRLELVEDVPKDPELQDGSIQGQTDFGRVGYGGPCPPPGRPHRYFFKIYALDKKLSLSSKASKADVEEAMKGHVLGQGALMGRYGR
jgi:Raf kinase inhibitor-like YbhB/YbcL family protein